MSVGCLGGGLIFVLTLIGWGGLVLIDLTRKQNDSHMYEIFSLVFNFMLRLSFHVFAFVVLFE